MCDKLEIKREGLNIISYCSMKNDICPMTRYCLEKNDVVMSDLYNKHGCNEYNVYLAKKRNIKKINSKQYKKEICVVNYYSDKNNKTSVKTLDGKNNFFIDGKYFNMVEVVYKDTISEKNIITIVQV